MIHSPVPEVELRRFAIVAAPLLQGAAAYGYGPRAAKNRAGRGLEFLDTRRYEHGDDYRAIDWRQSARSANLVIRRYQEESAADWFICVDRSASVAWGKEKWPMTIRLAAAITYALLHAGHRVALVFWSDRVHETTELGRGAHHFAKLLRTLIDHRPQSPTESGQLASSNLGVCRPAVTRNSNIFVLSDFLTENGMQRDLKGLCARAASVNAIQTLDAAEVSLPLRGSSALQDSESREVQQTVVTDGTEREAAAMLRAHNETLQRTCHGLNIRLTPCDTGQRWQEVLLRNLQLRS